MYIEPNSNLRLFKNLKLDSNYANTMWFSNIGAQNSFFAEHTYRQFTRYSYQRKDVGVLRLEARIADVFDVNYMAFINESFEHKWFYAFVTSVEYVNNETVNLYYTLDVIQTYMFDWDMHQCVIERQHSTTDVAGDNLEVEGLNVGDAIADGQVGFVNWGGYAIYMGLSTAGNEDLFNYVCNWAREWSANQSSGYGIVNGIPTGVPIFKFVANYPADSPYKYYGFARVIEYLNQQNQIDSIAFTFYAPEAMFNLETETPTDNIVELAKPTTVQGYTPKNKKVLTYPYCYMNVSNDQNESIDFRYETFGENCNFKIRGVTNSTPECIALPMFYDSNAEYQKYGLSLTGFPQIPYTGDGYKAWLAMNYDSVELSREVANRQFDIETRGVTLAKWGNAISGVGNFVRNGIQLGGAIQQTTGGILGPQNNVLGIVGAGVNMAEGLAQTVINDKNLSLRQESNELSNYRANQSADIAESVAKKLPNSPHVGNNSTSVAIEHKGFYFQKMSIRRRFAEKIDKYFTMFGYAQNIVGIPNLHVRPEFTYVKTNGCTVTGSIPTDDRDIINTVFDRGIRFWTNYANFENYDVDNSLR